MKNGLTIGLLILGILGIATALYYFLRRPFSSRDALVEQWIKDPKAHPEWMVQAKQHCLNAPFILPTNGFIGYLWDDTFQPFHRHQGIDIFGPAGLGETPVYAVYSGFLTRLPDWKSSLIIRIPKDPLQPERQIWTYFTHMANAQGESYISSQFPPGTNDQPVEAGTLLGYQGNYSGNPADPVGIHLHFSVVKDNYGKFLNELDINNTLDPSPYLGLGVNANSGRLETPIVCPTTAGGS